MQASQNGHGISAVLTSLGQPAVESGHVAGWVGVGGPGQGPGGSDEWIQVGLNSLPGTGNKLYYEVMRPGAGASYAEVATNVSNGRAVRVAVLETASSPNSWRVWVGGRPVTPPIELPGSQQALTPMAMGESWDGGRPACNRFSYRFERVSIAAAPGGSWQAARDAAVLQDPGYRVVKRAAGLIRRLGDPAAAGRLSAAGGTPRCRADAAGFHRAAGLGRGAAPEGLSADALARSDPRRDLASRYDKGPGATRPFVVLPYVRYSLGNRGPQQGILVKASSWASAFGLAAGLVKGLVAGLVDCASRLHCRIAVSSALVTALLQTVLPLHALFFGANRLVTASLHLPTLTAVKVTYVTTVGLYWSAAEVLCAACLGFGFGFAADAPGASSIRTVSPAARPKPKRKRKRSLRLKIAIAVPPFSMVVNSSESRG